MEIVPQGIPAQDLPELIAIGPQKHETQDERTVESSVVCSLNSGILVMGVLNMDNIQERTDHFDRLTRKTDLVDPPKDLNVDVKKARSRIRKTWNQTRITYLSIMITVITLLKVRDLLVYMRPHTIK